jgi:lysophospholipase L1-like esterase
MNNIVNPRPLRVLAILLCFGVIGAAKDRAEQEHWVPTWAAAPQQPLALVRRPPAANGNQQGALAMEPVKGFHDQTLRMIAHTSIAGRRVRIELSNAYGAMPLAVGGAHIALRSKDSAIVPDSDRALTFGGRPACKIPPGAVMLSDPVDLAVPKLGDIAVSLYLPNDTGSPTMHALGLHTTYISKSGDVTGAPAMNDAETSQSIYWLSRVDVLAPANAAALVTFGDSITDGATSTPDTDRSWPSYLARRLAANPRTANIAVINEGISGNRVLHDFVGTNALARFDRDVLSQPGVRWVMILEGINDIGFPARPGATPEDSITADDLIVGLKQMVDRAHEHGIKVIGCTLTPFSGAAYYSEIGENMRDAVNRWIRTGGAFDAVVDFDAATRDPENSKVFRAGYNTSDHLHPNDAGYKAMADAVDLAIFK